MTMRLSKNKKEKIIDFVKKEMAKNQDPFHDWDHAQKVSTLAAIIAKKEKGNILICELAGLLHDIAPKKKGQLHGLESAQKAECFLQKIGVDKNLIKQIYLAIVYHDTKQQQYISTLEGEIVFEADKLQCFGPVGIFREFGDLLLRGVEPHLAYQELLVYLKKFNPPFKTKTGKRLEKILKNFDRTFVKLAKHY